MSWRAAWALGALCGVLAGLLVTGAPGAAVGCVCAGCVATVLRRCESPAVRRERARAAAQLPVAADLLSAALRAGAAPDVAAAVVGAAIGGPVGDRLVLVARALRIGLPPTEAWARLTAVPDAERISAAAVRSAERGTALTIALDRLADDLRAARAAQAEAAARRVGVLGVLPLGLCFLPAFLLTSVVPVVTAIFGDLLRP
jgi:Flp pilus assembly protein TadB